MGIKEILQKAHTGKLYNCEDKELIKIQRKTQKKLHKYNMTNPARVKTKQKRLESLFASFGKNSFIEGPIYSNWGCSRVHIGDNVYSNSNLTLVDDTFICIDDNVMIGPNVTLCTATHPISPELREKQIQYNLPIRIEKNAWIGGNVFIMPGVKIGANSVIGAGSLVLCDIPSDCVAAGSPCKVIRSITDEDRKTYNHGKKIEL